jgi:hypothetical protein
LPPYRFAPASFFGVIQGKNEHFPRQKWNRFPSIRVMFFMRSLFLSGIVRGQTG